MPRIPLPIVFLLCPAVIAGVWWKGTRGVDFLREPRQAEIDQARREVARDLARPAELFAVERPPAALAVIEPEPEPAPAPIERAPVIEPGDLDQPPALDAWSDQADKPVASFIDLASRLETATRFPHALLAWERIIDHGQPDPSETEAALNGIRRLRASLPPWQEAEPAGALELRVSAPRDRLQLTRQACAAAAEVLDRAASGLVTFQPQVRAAGEEDAAQLTISIAAADAAEAPATALPAPETPQALEDDILRGAFRLVASTLALDESLRPLPAPPEDESPADAIQTRVTRLAWRNFARSLVP